MVRKWEENRFNWVLYMVVGVCWNPTSSTNQHLFVFYIIVFVYTQTMVKLKVLGKVGSLFLWWG